MTYYVNTSLWDFAEITARLIDESLTEVRDGEINTPYLIREAKLTLDRFIVECSNAYAEFETKDADEALNRAKILFEQIQARSSTKSANNFLREAIRHTQRKWCAHNDHLAEAGQSEKVGVINGYTACQDCYATHLAQIAEDEEFERSCISPNALN